MRVLRTLALVLCFVCMTPVIRLTLLGDRLDQHLLERRERLFYPASPTRLLSCPPALDRSSASSSRPWARPSPPRRRPLPRGSRPRPRSSHLWARRGRSAGGCRPL